MTSSRTIANPSLALETLDPILKPIVRGLIDASELDGIEVDAQVFDLLLVLHEMNRMIDKAATVVFEGVGVRFGGCDKVADIRS